MQTQQDGVPEIAEWAGRLEAVMAGAAPEAGRQRSLVDAATQAVREHLRPGAPEATAQTQRYIGGIR